MAEKDDHLGAERMHGMLSEMAGRDLWEELLQLRDRQREYQKNAVWLIKGKELPWEYNKQGKMRWYMHPLLNSICINTLKIFVQELPPGSRSGRIHHPGNQVIFILEGSGYTVLDGQKHHWSKNDVVQLPLRTTGSTVQHFNSDPDKCARFVACEPNTALTFGVDRGSGFEQLEVSPDYRVAKQDDR